MPEEKKLQAILLIKKLIEYYASHWVDFTWMIRFVEESKSASDYELDLQEEHWLFFDNSIDPDCITAWREWEHMVKEFPIKDHIIDITIDICDFIVKYNYQNKPKTIQKFCERCDDEWIKINPKEDWKTYRCNDCWVETWITWDDFEEVHDAWN